MDKQDIEKPVTNDTARSGRAGRYAIIGIAGIVAIVLIGFLWTVYEDPVHRS